MSKIHYRIQKKIETAQKSNIKPKQFVNTNMETKSLILDSPKGRENIQDTYSERDHQEEIEEYKLKIKLLNEEIGRMKREEELNLMMARIEGSQSAFDLYYEDAVEKEEKETQKALDDIRKYNYKSPDRGTNSMPPSVTYGVSPNRVIPETEVDMIDRSMMTSPFERLESSQKKLSDLKQQKELR